MALGIRGANPIWAEFNLQGQIFDDTYYMWVLENIIPYIPAPVYHDPNLGTPWDNPIRFYGNGTLPNDIYFETDKVYRLEFRQNDGTLPPSQNDPLIYEVNNYVAGSGGSGPIDTVASTSSNQVTNPQFALINFSSPYSLSAATNPDPIDIGPGWSLVLTGTGNLTMQQVQLNDTNINPSNAPYALQLTLSGWSSATVRQRFQQNGMLWANKYVSSALTAKLTGAPQPVLATLKDSEGATLGVVLDVPAVNEEWNQFTGYVLMPETTNTDLPPSAYIDYLLTLPNNSDIFISSIALVVQDLPIQPSFEQDSIERQIDHTYHTAYPIVPVGTIIDFAGFTVPTHYYRCDGAAKNRLSDNLLFQALTTTESVTLTNASPTFTVVSSTDYHIGMPIEGTNIPAATTIANKAGTTITMSANATGSGASTVRFFATGAGDGSTTFNVPLTTDYVTADAGGSLFGTASNGIGATGGSATHTIAASEIPARVPVGATSSFSTQSVATGINTNVPGGAIAWAPGAGGAMTIVQQTYLVKKCIRYR